MYKLITTQGLARRGRFTTVHGTIEMPAFMNVGTSAAIKGGVSSYDLKDLHCQVELCNTYHLHVRPGDDLIYRLGGLHKFMGKVDADPVPPRFDYRDGFRRMRRKPVDPRVFQALL